MRNILLFSLLFYFSCSGVYRAKKIKQFVPENNHKFRLENGHDSIKVSYIGCGGFLIKKNTSSIMVDPYFSNLSPLPLIPFKKLKTDTTIIASFFKRHFRNNKDKKGELKAILVAHSHYDHLADVPSIFLKNCNQDSTEIIGSKTTRHILKGAGIECKLIKESFEKTITKNEKKVFETSVNDFIYSKNGRIRILPISSEHAPHILGMKLISSKKIKKDFSKFPKKARKFPEGENYNFLIDFLDEKGKVNFRVFSNAGAACNSGFGLPTHKMLKEKKVDILLLCVASFNQVDDYPEVIIEQLKPKHIILNHWENFFRPINKLQKKAAVVPGTNVNKFIKKLNKLSISEEEFTMPLPLTDMIFYY